MEWAKYINKDYGRGLILDGSATAEEVQAAFERGQGVPILSMAVGPIGTIRALEVRCGPILRTGKLTVAAAKLVEGIIQVTWWHITVDED